MTNKKIPQRDRSRPMFAAIVALFAMIATSRLAFAQQGQFQPLPPQPSTQGQGGGVLELPTIPGHQGGGGPSATIPPLAPQPGQALTVPPHQLKSQQGYEQVTVTVTDQDGTVCHRPAEERFQAAN